MKVTNVLKEKHYTGPLYHATTLYSANLILSNGAFKLSYAGNDYNEMSFQNKHKDYFYFLSTSRIKQNEFRAKGSNKNFQLYVTFVLDGNYYNSRYHVAPMDYHTVDKHLVNKRKEAEERIWHTDSTIPTKNILECHVFIDFTLEDYNSDNAIQVEKQCRKMGIKSFYYNNYDDYLNMNKRRSGTLQPYVLRDGRDFVKVDYKRKDHMSESVNTLMEKHYAGPLYHITRSDSAFSILKTQMFKASNRETNISQALGKDRKGYHYFISVGREKTSRYRVNKSNAVGKPITLILDTEYYNKSSDYIIKPVDYYGYYYLLSKKNAEVNKRPKGYNEAEERIWSKTKFIPAKILEIHFLSNSNYNMEKEIYQIAQEADRNGIPHYVYQSLESYLLLNKRKALNILEQ